MALTDENCPVLTIYGHLRANGWENAQRALVHDRVPADKTPKLFDGRGGCSRKYYLQTLLDLPTYLALSTTHRIPSNDLVLFYRLLLRGERVTPGLSNKEYILQFNRAKSTKPKELLALPAPGGGGAAPLDPDDFGVLPLQDRKRRAPKSTDVVRRGGAANVAKGGGGAASSSGVPGPPVVPLGAGGAVCPGPDLVDPVGPGGAGADGEDFGADPLSVPEPPAPKRRKLDKPDWKPAIPGTTTEICFMLYVHVGGKADPNFLFKCDKHTGCKKRRGYIDRYMARHGVVECAAYLWAWRDIQFPTKPTMMTHAQENPTQSQVDAIVANHRPELEAMIARCGL